MKRLLILLVICSILPYAALADELHLIIGQIQASGATADDEFIELLNPTAQSVDLGSWSIQYKSAGGSTYYKKNFSKGASIPGNGTYLIAGSGYAGSYDMKHSSFSLSAAGGTVFLVSNQTLITSSDSPAIVDQKTYNAAAAENPNSNNPIPHQNALNKAGQIPNTNTNVNANTPANNSTPTTAAPISPPRPTDILPVTINEFMAEPNEGKEWIEIYNGTGYAVDLAEWTIADGTGKNISNLEGLIQPSGFKLVELAASRLNDGGDLISLRNAENKEVDAVAYGAWDDGMPAAAVELSSTPSVSNGVAVARIADGRDTNDDNSDFALTANPTPGEKNIIVSPATTDQPLTASIKSGSVSGGKSPTLSKTDTKWLADLLSQQNDEIAKLLKADNIIIINNLIIGSDAAKPIEAASVASKTPAKTAASKTTTVKTTAVKTTSTKTANMTSGMVIVPAGVVGKDICVVREENRSVEVRLPPAPKQLPVAGDIVMASGSWSTAKTLTLPRLLVRTASAFAITDHEAPPDPTAIPMSQINKHIGEIVSTTGTVVEKQSTRLRIADGSDSLVIKTKFNAVKNDKLSATGLLTKDAADTLLTPLTPEALSIINPLAAAAPSLAQKALPYGIAVVPAGILSTAVYFGKRLKKRKEVTANEQ